MQQAGSQILRSYRASGKSASLARCCFCGTRLSPSPVSQARRAFSSSSGAASPSSSNTSSSSLRVPRWAITSSRQMLSTFSTSSSNNLIHRRSFATVLEIPTAAEEDLPEPLIPIQKDKQSASDTINITPAAEKQLALIQERDNDPNLALRILVESGGCHGYSTKLELADVSKDRAEDDYILSAKSAETGATKTGLLLVDALTLSLIKGSTLDYATELIGSSFRLIDNPQATGKGCGCGISWELKI